MLVSERTVLKQAQQVKRGKKEKLPKKPSYIGGVIVASGGPTTVPLHSINL